MFAWVLMNTKYQNCDWFVHAFVVVVVVLPLLPNFVTHMEGSNKFKF